jgi:hypothetical protein
MENSKSPTMARAVKVTLVGLCNAFILASALLWPLQAGLSQTAALIPNAKQVFLNVNGAPLAGGSVFSYVPNTTVPKTTWSDPNQANPNTSPVTLDAAGGAFIFGQGNYRQIVKDVNGNTIWDGFTSAYGSSAPSGSSGTDTAPVGTILPWAGFNFNVPTNWQLAYGQAVSRTTFAQLLAAITISTTTGNCVSSSTTLSGFADTSQMRVGAPIEASCLPTGDTVATIVNGTTITVSVAATATGTFTVTAFPWGNGDGVSTFNLPDLRGRVLPGADAMGGTAASRLTSAFYGASASPPGVAGGAQSQTASTSIAAGNVPTINSSAANSISVNASGFNIAAANTAISNALGPGSGGGNYAFSSGGSFSTLTSINSSGSNTISVASTNTGGGSPPAASSAAFSVVQPSMTMDYIIKVAPNTTGAGGVTSFGGMFGDIICASTLTCGPVGSPAVNTVGCTTATPSQLGCVSPDNSTITATGGVLSAHGAAQNITVGTTNVFNGPGVLYNSSSGGALQALSAVPGGVLSFSGSTLQASTALPNGVTATTQGPGDSTLKVATDAYVENEISRNLAGNIIHIVVTQSPYNAVADLKSVTDGAMGSGSTTLTSASAPFSSADCNTGGGCTGATNKLIGVVGAGSAGAVLWTTITNFTNSSTVTLAAANASGGSVSGKTVEWGTDNTTAFNNAIAAACTNGGQGYVLIPDGIFGIKTLNMTALGRCWLQGNGWVGNGTSGGSRLEPMGAYNPGNGHVIDRTGSLNVTLKDFQVGAFNSIATPATCVFDANVVSAVSNQENIDNIYCSGQYTTATYYNFGVPSSQMIRPKFYNYYAGAAAYVGIFTNTNPGGLTSQFQTVNSGGQTPGNIAMFAPEFHYFTGTGTAVLWYDGTNAIALFDGVVTGGATSYVKYSGTTNANVAFYHTVFETESQTTPTNAHFVAAGSLTGFHCDQCSYIGPSALFAGLGGSSFSSITNGIQLVFNSGTSTVAANTTAYVGSFGFSTASPNISGIILPVAGTFANLHVFSNTTPGGAQTYTLTLYVNGATALTCNYSGATNNCVDNSHFVNVTAGAIVALTLTTSATANPANVMATVEYHPYQ